MLLKFDCLFFKLKCAARTENTNGLLTKELVFQLERRVIMEISLSLEVNLSILNITLEDLILFIVADLF